MRHTFRRKVAESTRLLSGTAEYSYHGRLLPCGSGAKRFRGGILPAEGPLQGSILGVEAKTDGDRYVRLVAFASVKPEELCDNSLMFVPYVEDVPASELLLYLEPALRSQVRSLVVYEIWNTKNDTRFREKLTAEDISAVITPITWKLPLLERGKLAVKVCSTVSELLNDAPSYFGTAAQIFRNDTSLGIYGPEFAPIVAAGIAATEALVTHILYSHYVGTELRLSGDFHDQSIHERQMKKRR